MSTIKTRPASQTDAGLLATMHGASFDQAWDERAMLSLLQHGARAWFGSCDTKDIGFCLIRVADDEAELLSIAVLPEARQQGMGVQLLETAGLEAKKGGAATLFLEVAADNIAACRLYEKNGFIRIAKRPKYYANGADALIFRRSLE